MLMPPKAAVQKPAIYGGRRVAVLVDDGVVGVGGQRIGATESLHRNLDFGNGRGRIPHPIFGGRQAEEAHVFGEESLGGSVGRGEGGRMQPFFPTFDILFLVNSNNSLTLTIRKISPME